MSGCSICRPNGAYSNSLSRAWRRRSNSRATHTRCCTASSSMPQTSTSTTPRPARHCGPFHMSARHRPSWSLPRAASVLDPALGYLIILGIALLFASAGAHKLRDLARFADVFAAYRVFPNALARRLAWLIPSLELGLAAGLLWGPGRRTAVIAAFIVLIAYASSL